MSTIKDAFNTWWDGIARQGDPIRRPRLTEEAFEAGYRAASADCFTTRDQFAAKAIGGLVVTGENFDLPRLASYSYDIADAMLKARQA